MATNAPDTPTVEAAEESRTMTSIDLKFAPGSDNGGSSITGYLLFKDEGVLGSPISLLYNGTSKPEIIDYVASDL